jgi:hypothetical protein
MAHSPKGIMDMDEIVSRWHAGNSIRHISRALKIDRKTFRRHLANPRGTHDFGKRRHTVCYSRPCSSLIAVLATFMHSSKNSCAGVNASSFRSTHVCLRLSPLADTEMNQ